MFESKDFIIRFYIFLIVLFLLDSFIFMTILPPFLVSIFFINILVFMSIIYILYLFFWRKFSKYIFFFLFLFLYTFFMLIILNSGFLSLKVLVYAVFNLTLSVIFIKILSNKKNFEYFQKYTNITLFILLLFTLLKYRNSINMEQIYLSSNIDVLNRNLISFVTSVGLIIILYAKYQNRWLKLLKLLNIVLFIIILMVLKSKTVIIAFIISYILYTFYLFKINKLRRIQKLILGFMNLFIIFGLSFFAKYLFINYLSQYNEIALTFSGRVRIWETIIDFFKDSSILNKLFGYGFLTNYEILNVLFKSDYRFREPPTHAHNEILNILITLGYFGVFIFVFSLIFVYYSFFYRIKNKTSFDFLFITLTTLFLVRGIFEVSVSSGGIGFWIYSLSVYYFLNREKFYIERI